MISNTCFYFILFLRVSISLVVSSVWFCTLSIKVFGILITCLAFKFMDAALPMSHSNLGQNVIVILMVSMIRSCEHVAPEWNKIRYGNRSRSVGVNCHECFLSFVDTLAMRCPQWPSVILTAVRGPSSRGSLVALDCPASRITSQCRFNDSGFIQSGIFC